MRIIYTRLMQHALAVFVLIISANVHAQIGQEKSSKKTADESIEEMITTGDARIDKTLKDIDQYGKQYPDAFVDELVRYHYAPRDLIEPLLENKQMQAGDIYFACVYAHIQGRPCRALLDIKMKSQVAGWQSVLESAHLAWSAEIKQRMRQAMASSYTHWDRPVN